jgi:hypothetical protein
VCIQIINANTGALIRKTGFFSLDPLRGANASLSNPELPLFCHFNVEGVARDVRATGCIGLDPRNPDFCIAAQ